MRRRAVMDCRGAQDRCVQVRGVDNEVGAFATVGKPEVQPLSLEVAQQTVVWRG